MPSTKRWFKKPYPDSQDRITDAEISWSSSSSDDQSPESNPAKKSKFDALTPRKKCKQWIKQTAHKGLIDSSSRGVRILKLIVSQQPSADSEPKSFFQEVINNAEDSPILSGLNYGEMSPVLSQKANTDCCDMSPVLGKHKKVKAMRHKYQVKQLSEPPPDLNNVAKITETETEEDSPDWFAITQATQLISQSNSPRREQLPTFDHSPLKSQSRCVSTCNIDNFSSQSTVIIMPVHSSPDAVSSNSGCHLKKPKKRRRFKKGGLLSQLEQVLRAKQGAVAIWQHEVLTNKIDLESVPQSEENRIICFSIMRRWEEFSNQLYECFRLRSIPDTPGPEIANQNELPGDDSLIGDKFILMISIDLNQLIIQDSVYRLFPPFSERVVQYEDALINCYFNASRILKCR